MNQAGFTPIVAEPRRWDVLAGFMIEQGYKTFVEVGCKEGRTTGHILKSVPDSQAWAIDPWFVQAPTTADAETYNDWNFASIEAEFWKNVGPNKDRCVMLRKTSADAALDFEVGRDLVFIDARHDYDSVLEDIRLWWPKVRVGGMLCGHDFNHKWPGVERAVADSFNLMHIGVTHDSVWFIVKHSEDQCAPSSR
jgi:hypothetical protein